MLLDLPEDIWTHLLPYIHCPSALNLALTCKDLQQYADQVIYRSIDVTEFPEEVVDMPSSLNPTAPLEPRQPDDHGSKLGLIENGWTNALRHEISSRQMLEIITKSLIARRERAKHVRKLWLVKSHRNWEAFVGIFRLVHSNLVELNLKPTEFADEAWLDMECALGTKTALSLGDNIHLSKLTRLAMPMESAFRPLAVAIVGAATHLRRWDILPVAYSRVHHAKDVAPLPYMQHLESVSVEEITPDIAAELPGLIASTSTLRRIRLFNDAPGRYFDTPGKKEILASLSAHAGLERLAIDEALFRDWDELGFESVRKLEIRTIRDRCWSRPINEIKIPPLPKLEVLSFTAHDPYAWRSSSVMNILPCSLEDNQVRGSCPTPPTTTIPADFLLELSSAPSLHCITQRVDTCIPNSDAFELDYVKPAARSLEETVDIRKYSSGSKTFVHLKVCSHQVVLQDHTLRHLRDPVVQDFSDYDGRPLSADELDELYRVAGKDRHWKGGCRNLSLSSQAWNYLENLAQLAT